MNIKQIITGIVAVVGLLLIAVFGHGLYSAPKTGSQLASNQQPVLGKVASTDPSPLEGATLLPNQPIELNFSTPLWTKDELKVKVDPELQIKVEVSEDRLKAKIIPVKGYDLGHGYTLFIKSDTNFAGPNNSKLPLGQDLLFHFRTIDYHGI